MFFWNSLAFFDDPVDHHVGPNISIICPVKNYLTWASLIAQLVKNPPAMQETPFDSWVGKISWRRAWQPTPGFLLGEFHGQRRLEGCNPSGHKESDLTEWLSTAHNLTCLWISCMVDNKYPYDAKPFEPRFSVTWNQKYNNWFKFSLYFIHTSAILFIAFHHNYLFWIYLPIVSLPWACLS